MASQTNKTPTSSVASPDNVTGIVTVAPSTEITRVIQVMISNDISGVLVVDDEGELVGILTERDCIEVASTAGYYDEWGGPAEAFMSVPVETVGPDENLVEMLRINQEFEQELIKLYHAAASHSARIGDHDSRLFFNALLEEERTHHEELLAWQAELLSGEIGD